VSPLFEGFAFLFSKENPNMKLAVFGDSNKDGAPIVQTFFFDARNQGFFIDNVGGSDNLVRLRHPGGKVITVWDGSKLEFAPMILSEWRHLANQQFFVHDMGDSLFRLVASHSGMALQVFAASSFPEAPMVQGRIIHGGDHQIWRIERIELG
jgi:hypothetical protein